MSALLAGLALLGGLARAEVPVEAPPGVPDVPEAPEAPTVRPALPAPPPFQAMGLFQARGTRSSVVATNPFLDGQVVGSLGGSNGTTTSLDERTMMAEQRGVGFFTWTPGLTDGRAALTAAFEIDFGWGDQAYQTGGNKGGGFGADQVNLQTRRLYATFLPVRGEHELKVLAGLQFVADGAADPHTSSLERLIRQGGGLGIWGSEAAGLSLYGRHRDGFGERLRWRLGAYTLVENGVGLADDLTLCMADATLVPAWRVDLGLHGWWLKDNTGGTGGSLGVGPFSQLSALQGGPSLAVGEGTAPDADLLWLAADLGFNRELRQGPLGARVFGLFNLGRLYLEGVEDVAVRGHLLQGEARWRYAPGSGSVLGVQGLLSSRDGTGEGAYTGVLTGNSYGIVGATWASHGALLLFPDPGAINRQVAVVADLSGGGQGLRALTVQGGYDLVPERLTAQGTLAMAATGRGEAVGRELGLGLLGRPLPLLDLGLRAAVVPGAYALDPSTGARTALPSWPWTVIAHLQWLLL